MTWAGRRRGGAPGPTGGRGPARPAEPDRGSWGRRRVRAAADDRRHGEGERRQRDVAVPAVPAPGLVVVQPELVLGGLERVLDRPAPPPARDRGLDRGPGRAPGREEGEPAVGDGAPDRQAPRPPAGAAVPVPGSPEVGQLQTSPVVQPRT